MSKWAPPHFQPSSHCKIWLAVRCLELQNFRNLENFFACQKVEGHRNPFHLRLQKFLGEAGCPGPVLRTLATLLSRNKKFPPQVALFAFQKQKVSTPSQVAKFCVWRTTHRLQACPLAGTLLFRADSISCDVLFVGAFLCHGDCPSAMRHVMSENFPE